MFDMDSLLQLLPVALLVYRDDHKSYGVSPHDTYLDLCAAPCGRCRTMWWS